MNISEDVKKRFFDKVEIPEDTSKCWIWTGSIGGCRYGGFLFNGKVDLAHRVSWMIHNGKIPDGMCVCHHCDNTKCVNPEHLFVGTQIDNIKDMCQKNRQRSLSGESNPQAKMTDLIVKEIKELYKIGMKTCEISVLLNINRSTIENIKYGRRWKHITI